MDSRIKIFQNNCKIVIAENYQKLCDLAVKKILDLSKKAIKERKRFSIVCSGGETPKGVYSLMVSSGYKKLFCWDKIHVFLGDERWVPEDSPKSNYRMIKEKLLSKIKIPEKNIHYIKTNELNLEKAAILHEKEIKNYFRKEKDPNFDLVMLGLGEDGHVASIFSGTPELKEERRLVVGVNSRNGREPRITITLPLINGARNILFLVSGSNKRKILKTILEKKDKTLPASKIRSRKGNLLWIVEDSLGANLK